MSEILTFLTSRSVLIFISTAFSLLFVMLALNIITVDETIKILNMSPEAGDAFRLVVSRVQEVTGNVLNIISQLLNKLFSWAGVDVDLSKIQVDTHQHSAVEGVHGSSATSAHSASGSENSAVK